MRLPLGTTSFGQQLQRQICHGGGIQVPEIVSTTTRGRFPHGDPWVMPGYVLILSIVLFSGSMLLVLFPGLGVLLGLTRFQVAYFATFFARAAVLVVTIVVPLMAALALVFAWRIPECRVSKGRLSRKTVIASGLGLLGPLWGILIVVVTGCY